MTDHKKTVIILAGPTAVGKTAVAINLARHFKTEIISADSRQCYQELNIGVARPSVEELEAVPHHFIASHSIQEELNAAWFEQYALAKARELFQQYPVLVMTGGTGLYIKAFCEGLDAIPAIPPGIREKIMNGYAAHGIEWLQAEIREKDPAFFNQGEIMNPQRVMRALEVMEATGNSILAFRKGNKTERDFNIIRIGLDLPRETLYSHINTRTGTMIRQGLLEETEGLLPFRHLNALQTVGYKELFDYFDQLISRERAIELIRQHTRQYAKRQLTWFRKEKDFKWFSPLMEQDMITYLENQL
ncbi:MAG: tRNA (adenosine(37)-N6)-dimethylallyltransferase MiaA [Terrimonas sp.]|nr:tRNA (adenosine(37)-N6)-dimethylallyltransferase MiaA [Terrimonas sp.]